MEKFFSVQVVGDETDHKIVDDPIPTVEFPQVSQTHDPRTEGTLAISYFRVDAFARIIVKKLKMSGNNPEAFVRVRVTDAQGAVAKEAQIPINAFAMKTPSDEMKQTFLDSTGLTPGIYKVEFYGIYGAMGLLGGYVIFASAAQLSTEWGPAWGQVLAPDGPGEHRFTKSFNVLLGS